MYTFVHALYRIASYSTCHKFFKHAQTSKLGGGLTICDMTIGQGSDAWNTQLKSECLLGNGKWSLKLAAACEVWKEIKFEF